MINLILLNLLEDYNQVCSWMALDRESLFLDW